MAFRFVFQLYKTSPDFPMRHPTSEVMPPKGNILYFLPPVFFNKCCAHTKKHTHTLENAMFESMNRVGVRHARAAAVTAAVLAAAVLGDLSTVPR